MALVTGIPVQLSHSKGTENAFKSMELNAFLFMNFILSIDMKYPHAPWS